MNNTESEKEFLKTIFYGGHLEGFLKGFQDGYSKNMEQCKLAAEVCEQFKAASEVCNDKVNQGNSEDFCFQVLQCLLLITIGVTSAILILEGMKYLFYRN